ncbi:hypothetical protein AAG906_013575 [Vitis piasezkii]
MNSMNYRMNNNRKKADNFVDGVREHGKKFELGARILQIGESKEFSGKILVLEKEKSY